jgi:hypothetical protein
MLKICFVTAEMAPLWRGPGDVRALVQYLHGDGHDVRLSCRPMR